MQGTVNGFSYGLVTPVVAFLMACLGGALGLRCVAYSLRGAAPWRPGLLALGAVAIGCGCWTMHVVAMTGFSVTQVRVGYDGPTMFASLAVGIVMIGVGLFLVAHRGATPMALLTGGTVAGLGIASMHYLGMAGLRLKGQLEYSTGTVVASGAVGVVAAIAALYAVARHRGLTGGLASALALGVAATGTHYTAMSGAHVHLASGTALGPAGRPDTGLLLPMAVGPAAFLLLAALVMVFEPRLLSGGARDAEGPGEGRRTGGLLLPAQRTGAYPPHTPGRATADSAPQPSRRGSPDFHDW
jgi:NO-binding membrane sensor protein with MHYT domain